MQGLPRRHKMYKKHYVLPKVYVALHSVTVVGYKVGQRPSISFNLSVLFHFLPLALLCTGVKNQANIKEDWTVLRYGRLCQTNPEDGRSPSFLQGLSSQHPGNHSLCWHWPSCLWGVSMSFTFTICHSYVMQRFKRSLYIGKPTLKSPIKICYISLNCESSHKGPIKK